MIKIVAKVKIEPIVTNLFDTGKAAVEFHLHLAERDCQQSGWGLVYLSLLKLQYKMMIFAQ